MPRTIILDSLKRGGINVFVDDGGSLRVEAHYTLRAGTEAVQAKHVDITSRLTAAQLADIASAYNSIFARLEAQELA